jgi:Ca-activated chloride channel homolog
MSPRRWKVALVLISCVSVICMGCSQSKSTSAKTAAVPAERSVAGSQAFNTEEYRSIEENAFFSALEQPLSTFSIDVDTASYSNVRRILREGRLPPPGAVRIEELVNYFDYEYPEPDQQHPFSVSTEVAACPWNAKNQLIKIGLKGKSSEAGERKSARCEIPTSCRLFKHPCAC